MNILEISANSEMIGLRADKGISLISEVGSRNRAQFLIDKGLVQINGKNIKASYLISINDKIKINFPPATSSELLPLEIKLDILFEDDDLIVLTKPAGLVVHPAHGHANDTLVNALLSHTKNLSMKFGEDRPGIVHRLDKETSGVMLVAKNDFSHENLSQQFRVHSIHRIYFAIAIGEIKPASGLIKSFISRHPVERKKFASVLDENKKIQRNSLLAPNSGKWSVTHYWTLKTHVCGLSYMKLRLETGRTHQIRVHLSEAGCPLIGDEAYGARKKIKNSSPLFLREIEREIPRVALHAAELGFRHPRTNHELLFQAPWPSDFEKIVNKLGFL